MPGHGNRKGSRFTLARLVPLAMLLVSFLLLVPSAQPDARTVAAPEQNQAMDAAYDVLRKLLSDEQYLKTLRLAKSVVSLQAVSEPTRNLVDDVAGASSVNSDQLAELAALQPRINFDISCSSTVDKAMLDRMRLAAVKDLIMAPGGEFEVQLVVSQVQALRMISQLAGELHDIDPNVRRKVWLEKLSDRYTALYKRAVTRLSLAGN